MCITVCIELDPERRFGIFANHGVIDKKDHFHQVFRSRHFHAESPLDIFTIESGITKIPVKREDELIF